MKFNIAPTSLWKEFRDFAFKGNIVDLAVAVILGAAFTGVVNSLVKNVFMPLISYVTPNMTYVEWHIGKIMIGAFLAELFNFVVVAFAVFIFIVKLLGLLAKMRAKEQATAAPTTRECPMCCSTINIKAKKCPNCTSDVPAVESAAPAEVGAGA